MTSEDHFKLEKLTRFPPVIKDKPPWRPRTRLSVFDGQQGYRKILYFKVKGLELVGMYSICIRQESGFCCIEYTPCLDIGSFSIDTSEMLLMAMIDSACSVDYIGIEGASGFCSNGCVPPGGATKLCGGKFNALPLQGADAPVCETESTNGQVLDIMAGQPVLEGVGQAEEWFFSLQEAMDQAAEYLSASMGDPVTEHGSVESPRSSQPGWLG
eukprot:maker-scaffold47_size466558-snap-gene-0.16 protein:Tk04175 transcript:maker-scaffold47_size466558-snap-gene-0.16-mRNA-1 annotation:"PREDICTED: uncharacterized protein LOC658432"